MQSEKKMQENEISEALKELDEQEVKVPFGELDQGHMYRIRKLERTETRLQGKVINGLRANLDIGDEAVKLFTYLPNAMKNMKDNLIAEINASAVREEHYGLCYYGSMGSSNIGRIHKPSEGVNEALLQRFTARKRAASSSEEGSSAKCAKF